MRLCAALHPAQPSSEHVCQELLGGSETFHRQWVLTYEMPVAAALSRPSNVMCIIPQEIA